MLDERLWEIVPLPARTFKLKALAFRLTQICGALCEDTLVAVNRQHPGETYRLAFKSLRTGTREG